MILADTSVWVDHFRRRDAELHQQLLRNNILIHPFVVTELVLGNLPDRQKVTFLLERLPRVELSQLSEVRTLIENHSLFQRGLGFVDVHLIASVLITSHTILWTRDKQLRKVAQTFGIEANLK